MTAQEQAWYDQWKVVHGIATSVGVERARGNMAGVDALLPYLRSNIEKLRALSVAADQAALSQWDRYLLALESNIGTAIQIPSMGIALALKPLVPYLIGGGLLYALFVLSPLIRKAGAR